MGISSPEAAALPQPHETLGEDGAGSLLSDALLARIGARAADYDRTSGFFYEDLADLKAAGYLRAFVPIELGGFGFSVLDIAREQARLAYRSASTALAINMHLYWVGAATHLWRRGDLSAKWILDEAVAGKVFAAGHGEPGNDLILAHSLVKATPLEHGAYRFDGHKILTSLAPAWDWLGVHGLNSSDPDAPKIVHAFIRRTDPGHRTVETWDALGVRSTRSDDTILEGVVANREHVTRILPAGPPVDPFIDGIFGSVMPGLAAVYYGIARRSFDLAVEEAKNRRSLALGGKPSTHSAFVQQSTAEAAIELDSIQALIERVADDWWNGVDHGDQWPAKLLAAKQHAVDGALRVVNLSLKIAGARSLSRRHELERLYRDVRAGAFHPPNTDAAHEIIGRTYLGVLGAA